MINEKELEQYIKENYKPIKAVFVGGILNGTCMNSDDLRFLPQFTGRYTESYQDDFLKGLCVPRQELWRQPIMKGYLSPMWDGGKLRYETQEVYNSLSI